MLSPEQVDTIQRLHWRKKWPLRKIARHLHIARSSIKKYLVSPSLARIRPQRSSKLDPYKQAVAELLQQAPTIRCAEIAQHLHSLGYSGGTTILRKHVGQPRISRLRSPLDAIREEVFDWMRAVPGSTAWCGASKGTGTCRRARCTLHRRTRGEALATK
jgi:hypothetical protein